jgi:hypothetical protein
LFLQSISPFGSLKIFPNPSKGEFSIKFPDSKSYFDGLVVITSTSGEIVYSNNLMLNNNDTYLFNNLDLTSGIYFIKLINNKGEYIYDKRFEIIK